MELAAVQALGLDDEVAPLARTPQAGGPAQAPFGELVARGLESVNEQLKASQVDLQQLALGEASSLHEVMVRLEQSRIAFELMMQVRSRVLEAYQDVMRMQI